MLYYGLEGSTEGASHLHGVYVSFLSIVITPFNDLMCLPKSVPGLDVHA